jgi:hypothetical protein
VGVGELPEEQLVKYHCKFHRDFEVDVDAETIDIARQLAEAVAKQFPTGTCRLHSIHVEGYVAPTTVVEPLVNLTPEAKAILERNDGLAANVRKFSPEPPEVA